MATTPRNQVDAMGAALAAGFVPILTDHFRVNANLDTSTWALTIANSATFEGSFDRLKTNTAANASIKLRSKRRARFIAGTVQSAQMAISLEDDLSPANNVRRWGLFDDDEGWFFEQSGGVLNAVLRRSGTDVKIPSTSWLQRVEATLNEPLRCEIRATHLPCEIVAYEFLVNGELAYRRGDGAGNPSPGAIELPLSVENINSDGGTANVGLAIRGLVVGRYGIVRGDEPRSVDIGDTSGVVKNKCGRLHRVIIGVAGADGDTVTFHNGTGTGGERLLVVDASIVHEVECGFSFDQLYAEVSSGATCDVVVVFD
jgi:hypothetical protein